MAGYDELIQKTLNDRKAAGTFDSSGTWGSIKSAPGQILGALNPFSQAQINWQGSNPQLGNGGQWGQDARSMAQRSQGRQAASSPWEQQQMALGQALARQMSGQDSISREQLRQDAGRNISMQQAMAASASPQNAAMAQRMASQNAGRINQGLAGQTAMAGIAERNAAANAMGQLSGMARGQDMQNFYQNRGQNDAMWQGAMGLGQNAAGMNLNAQTQQDQMRLQQAIAQAQQPSANQQLAGAVMGGLQTYSMFSNPAAGAAIGGGGAPASNSSALFSNPNYATQGGYGSMGGAYNLPQGK